MTRGRAIRVGLLVLVVGALVLAEVLTGGAGSSRPAPRLPAEVLSGHRETLDSLRGKPALVNFWASWCPPCKKEAPALEAFAQGLGGKATLVGIDWNDSAANARSFIAAHHLTYPILRDGDGSVGNAFGIGGLPTTFVIDSRGDIVETLTGPQSQASLSQALASAH